MADHLDDQFATTPAIVAAADATSEDPRCARPLVQCDDFHHPVVMAKEAATLDVLTHGRLRVRPRCRVDDHRLRAAAASRSTARPADRSARRSHHRHRGVVERRSATFAGTVSGHRARRLTRSRSSDPTRPSSWAAAAERDVVRSARHADIIGLNIDLRSGASTRPRADRHRGATDRKLGWIRDAAGDRLDEIKVPGTASTWRRSPRTVGRWPRPPRPAFGMSPESARRPARARRLGGGDDVEQCLGLAASDGGSPRHDLARRHPRLHPVVAAFRDTPSAPEGHRFSEYSWLADAQGTTQAHLGSGRPSMAIIDREPPSIAAEGGCDPHTWLRANGSRRCSGPAAHKADAASLAEQSRAGFGSPA